MTAAPGARVLLVAPFARGRSHGGSLRATAMAERLEARGAEVVWAEVPAVPGARGEKVRSLLAGEPAVVRTHTRRLPTTGGGWDAVIASHSYLGPVLDGLPARVARVVDFHNLEWRVLADTGRAEGGVHGAYLRAQGVLMRRFERALLRSGATAALACAEEHEWAARNGMAGAALVVPNVLPEHAVAEAERAAELRAAAAGEDTGGPRPLVYVGTLTFPPNVLALRRFLARDWPAIRAARPDAELLVAGRCAPELAAEVARHPGVRALGFAADLAALLARAAAVVLPFEGRGGSSLRALQLALAGVPVVAAPAAARGLPFAPGSVAGTPEEWAAAAGACLAGEPRAAAWAAAAQAGARAVQEHEDPWDALAGLVGLDLRVAA